MRKIRKHITTIILAVLAVIAGVYAYNYHDMKQNIVYNEHLDDVAVIVNGKELTLRDMAFYVAYEEMNVEKQALVYDSDNPNKYWNIHTNGEFVRVAARKAAMSMAIHDEIFYEMAKKESITLTDDEKAALKNSEKDFWYDLSDIDGAKKLGVEKKDIYSSMEKSAIARKYQEIYAGLDNADITDYDFSGGRYEKLLEKYKTCHAAFDMKLEKLAEAHHKIPSHSIIKTPDQIAGIKESAKINVAVLDYIGEHIHEGMNTAEIDKIVYDMTTSMGGIPAPLNYEGYPYSVCTSVNEQVCHGFPSKDVILKDGDIINVDCSTILNGYFSDSSRMYCIGNVSPEKKKLVEVTKECVELGLKEVKPWGFLGDMGQAVHDHAFANGYTVVREIGGHGVGLEFHEDPWVGYNTKRGTDMVMAPGMIFTIEPMVNMGKADIYVDDKNNWEVYTDDGLPSAQWEIMVLVTEDGHEVLSW